MKDIFTPDDFKEKFTTLQIEEYCAQVANIKLKEWLDKNSQTVYKTIGHKDLWSCQPSPLNNDIYKALLICVEELPKPKCTHDYISFLKDLKSWRCNNCHKKLKSIFMEIVE